MRLFCLDVLYLVGEGCHYGIYKGSMYCIVILSHIVINTCLLYVCIYVSTQCSSKINYNIKVPISTLIANLYILPTAS